MLGDRSQFDDLDVDVYFNHASISPLSRAVRAAAQSAMDDYARLGAGAWLTYRDQRERLREKLATLVGADAPDVALVPSTSQGIVDLALCFPWQRGDRILLFDGEFPANVTPWQRAAALFGAEILMHRAEDFRTAEGLDRLRTELARAPVRLVAVSAVQFQTGLRMPLRAIADACHAAGAELFVDAIQAVGAVPIDVRALDVDYLVAGSHKWLMGPEGCGLAYVRPDRIAALRPAVASWLSHEDPATFLFEGKGHLRYDRPIRTRADFLEVGAQNTVGFAALEASVDHLLEIGVARIHAHVQGILDPLEEALEAAGCRSLRSSDPAARSTILSCEPPDGRTCQEIFEHLAGNGVSCATPDGNLRFSPHWPNDVGQVAHVIDAWRAMP